MFQPCPLIASEGSGQPVNLDRLVDSQPCHQAQPAHQHNRRVSDALRRVIPALRRQRYVETRIVHRHLQGLARRIAVRRQFPPFARNQRIQNVCHPVDGKQPRQGKVKRHPVSQLLSEPEKAVEPVGEKVEQRHVAHSDAIRIISPIDDQAAVNHRQQQREVEPVKPPRGQFVLFLKYLHSLSITATLDSIPSGVSPGCTRDDFERADAAGKFRPHLTPDLSAFRRPFLMAAAGSAGYPAAASPAPSLPPAKSPAEPRRRNIHPAETAHTA